MGNGLGIRGTEKEFKFGLMDADMKGNGLTTLRKDKELFFISTVTTIKESG